MNEQRFQVLPGNQLAVWDTQEEKAIHLGSRVDAEELAEFLNGMHNKIKKLSVSNMRLTAARDKCLIKLGKLPTVEEEHYL